MPLLHLPLFNLPLDNESVIHFNIRRLRFSSYTVLYRFAYLELRLSKYAVTHLINKGFTL